MGDLLTPAFPPPEVIGCVGCGGEVLAEFAVWEQCATCGKTCGFCDLCASVTFAKYVRYPNDTGLRLAKRFVEESMERHEVLRHRLPERWQRARLTRMPKTRPRVELF